MRCDLRSRRHRWHADTVSTRRTHVAPSHGSIQLQTTRDDRNVGIFAGRYARIEADKVRSKVTDYVEYPEVPDGYTFVHYGCQLNGRDDDTVMGVLKSNDNPDADNPWLGTAIWARKLDLTTGKFMKQDPAAVKCLFEGMSEGYAGGSVDQAGGDYTP